MIALGVARLALFAAVGLAFGIGLFGAHHRRLLAALAAAGFTANLGWFAVLTAQMFEVPLAELSLDALVTALSMPAIGPAFAARALLLLVLVVASRWRWPSRILAAAALASLAWTGHAGAAPLPRLGAGIAHLLAAGAWIGAVASLWLGVRRGEADTAARAAAFARPGALIVALLVATGGLAIIGLAGEAGWPQLVGAPWAWLIAAKLLLFAGTLALAWRHRTRLVPAYADGKPGAAARLRTSLALEMVLLLGIFAAVAVAGQLDPAGG
ncbi:CopD family protein [Sandarakinorhabdus sp. AAP62]|uniref:CopD family protein n=1 Tax=Sandarakinorhabdus sp. AAP62 TaxID=1248916 RepID=UPI000315D8B8|nr:CopD family protein [Sandarakinorhabdus sp. AAP62]